MWTAIIGVGDVGEGPVPTQQTGRTVGVGISRG